MSKWDYGQSELSVFHAAWNTNPQQRSQSASGGAFFAIASYIIDEGGVVCGATCEGVTVKHIFIEKKEDLCSLQGSKYSHSIATGCYKKAFELLKDGRTLLFSGTGCQVAGLLSFLSNKKYSGRLITVDLICGGIPSYLLIKKFIENEPYKTRRIVSFRTKEHGWKSTGFKYYLKVEDTNGTIHDYTDKKNLITDGFCSELTERYSCYQCQYSGISRKSDFTIGDYWGDSLFKDQHYKGLSLIVAHHQIAEQLLNSMKAYLHIESANKCVALNGNKRLLRQRNRSYLMPERAFLESFFSHASYQTLKKIYANDYSRRSPWMLHKIIKYISKKVLQ